MSAKGQASVTLHIHLKCITGDCKPFYIEYEYLNNGKVKYGKYSIIAPNEDDALEKFWEFANAWETRGYDHQVIACYELPRG